jgi:PKD repeat protein
VSDVRRTALALLLGCLLLVAGASALDGYDYYQTIEYAACDQEIYQQDIVIHRSTGTAYNETSGGLETWHIYVGEHCREDYGDIRFVNSTGAELAYYLWPDYDSSSARVCVRLEGADAAGTLTVLYGNPTATTTSDGDATYFQLFDPRSYPPDAWTKVGATLTLSSETVLGRPALKLDRGTTTGRSAFIYQVATLPENYSVRAQVLVTDTSYNPAIGVCVALDPTDPHGYTSHLEGQSSFTNLIVERAYGATGFDRIASKAAGLPKNVWYTYVVSAAGTTYATEIYDNAGNLLCSHSWEDATYSRQYAGMRIWRTTGYVSEYEVRAYSTTPPAATTFSGEQETAAPPVTAFTASPTAGLAPLTVQFTDTSTGSPTSWAWTFGDGGTSSEQNPQHTYTAPGLYTVTLTATNEYGSDTETKTDYITVYGPVTAQFTATPTAGLAPLTVQFTDLSTGGPTSWLWTFGDGNTSTAQNPQHTYTTPGTHTVTLTASHPYDSDTETKTAYITVAVLQPFPGLPLIPRDLAGNGLYTDINGNNRLDYNDLTIFFQHLAWAKANQPTECFDFNGNGWLDYNDVITLFTTISGGA